MKVVKVGWNHPEWSREIECPHCGTILEITKTDLFTEIVGPFGATRTEVQCQCCVCHKIIAVAKNADEWQILETKQEWEDRSSSQAEGA